MDKLNISLSNNDVSNDNNKIKNILKNINKIK